MDWVDRDLNAYLDECERSEALSDAISSMAKDLNQPGGEMYPLESNNFWEAIFSESCFENFQDKTSLEDPTALGNEIIRCVKLYWADRASEEAEEHFTSGRNDE